MEQLLIMLKTDLGITTSAYDARLLQYLENAQRQIEQEGATVNTTDPLDGSLVVMYAAWMWRRRDSMEGMPRMLRWQLNNRIFAEKARGDA